MVLADRGSTNPAPGPIVVGAVVATAYAILFVTVAALGERDGQARRRIRHLESEHDAVTRRAVEDERRRLARELHDTVSHAVSLIAIQAGAARRVLVHEPDQTDEVLRLLESIEVRSREGMGELRRLLDVMRDRGEAPARAISGTGSPTSADYVLKVPRRRHHRPPKNPAWRSPGPRP